MADPPQDYRVRHEVFGRRDSSLPDTVTVRARVVGDINRDRRVDVSDLLILAGRYGLCVGQPGYDPRSDPTGDNGVDAADVLAVAANWRTYRLLIVSC